MFFCVLSSMICSLLAESLMFTLFCDKILCYLRQVHNWGSLRSGICPEVHHRARSCGFILQCLAEMSKSPPNHVDFIVAHLSTLFSFLSAPNCSCAPLVWSMPIRFVGTASYFMAKLTSVGLILFVQVDTKKCDIVATGIQFGLLGCLSTVSTFIAEFNAMRESKYPWRAYTYAMVTICTSFGLGTLIYSVPVWTKGYK